MTAASKKQYSASRDLGTALHLIQLSGFLLNIEFMIIIGLTVVDFVFMASFSASYGWLWLTVFRFATLSRPPPIRTSQNVIEMNTAASYTNG
jgi:hypothetical protein